MSTRLRSSVLGALSALAVACGAVPEADERAAGPPASGEEARDPLGTPRVLAVDGEGLQLVDRGGGEALAIPFGTPEARVLDALARSGGAAWSDGGAARACAADGVRARGVPDGFSVVFRDGALVGWALDGPGAGSVATPGGVGIGSTREQLEWTHAPHARREVGGDAFAAGGLRGTFEGDGPAARVRSLWAGATCALRAPLAALEPVTPETHGVLLEGIPPFEDLVANREGDWLVVLGSFRLAPGAEPGHPGPARPATLIRPSDPRAAALQQALWNEGVVPFAVWSDLLPGLAPRTVVLVEGPYPRERAEERLEALRPLVPDAYLKSGW